MDALREALRRKMEGSKGHGMELELEVQPSEETEDEREKLDLAPSLAKEEMMGESVPSPEQGDAMSPQIMEILESLAGRGPSGRGAMGLGERAAMAAKEKLDKVKSSKK